MSWRKFWNGVGHVFLVIIECMLEIVGNIFSAIGDAFSDIDL